MKVGDRVEITDSFLVKYLREKGISTLGTIIGKDGGYHYVRPDGATGKNHYYELYSNEIELLGE